MNLKAISLNVGRALLVSALFMFLSIVVSIMDGRDSGFVPLTISFIITFSLGRSFVVAYFVFDKLFVNPAFGFGNNISLTATGKSRDYH